MEQFFFVVAFGVVLAPELSVPACAVKTGVADLVLQRQKAFYTHTPFPFTYS